MRGRPNMHALMDADVGAYVVQVRIVDTFIYVAILIDIDLCIHHLYKHYVCNIDNYIDSLIERGLYR